jgi:EAL and modified HD-GYP domain-containing signal transduction protein
VQILVARQPIFDRHERLYGYDLILRRAGTDPNADAPPPEQLVADTFLGIGIDQVAAGRRAFINIDRDMLMSGAVRLLPSDRVVLQFGGDIGADDGLVAACEALAVLGYSFALSSDSPGTIPAGLLGVADIVKVDISAIDTGLLPELATWLRTHRVRLLALNVRNRVERDNCAKLGFELFEGQASTAPETLSRRDLPIEHVATFRLLKLMRDPKIGDGEIEDVLKHDVALSYKLLRMVNSAAVGGRNIWSIGHALRLLGRDHIIRWLSLLLVTDGATSAPRAELIHLALFRARMCELLADAAGVPRARGPLFLVGMFSVLDQLLETPIETLADSMELAPDVRLALLHRQDFYGSALSLVEAYERGAWDRVDALAGSLEIRTVDLPPMYLSALGWATEQQSPKEALVAAR